MQVLLAVLTALTIPAQEAGQDWSVKLEGAEKVFYSRPTGKFIVSQDPTPKSEARLVFLSENSGVINGTSHYFDFIKTESLGWVGTDENGAALLYRSNGGLLKASEGGLASTDSFGFDGWPSIYGKWMVKAYASSLVLLNRDGPISILPGIGHSDTYGVDPGSGRMAGLIAGKGGLKLVFRDVKGPLQSHGLVVPRGTTDGFPDTSLEFIDKDHFVCILTQRVTGNYESYRQVLAIVDVPRRTARFICAFESELGHQMPATRGRLAVGRTHIAYLASGGVFSVRISRILDQLGERGSGVVRDQR